MCVVYTTLVLSPSDVCGLHYTCTESFRGVWCALHLYLVLQMCVVCTTLVLSLSDVCGLHYTCTESFRCVWSTLHLY